MVRTPTRTETEQGKKGRSRPVALGKVNLLLVLLALLVLAGAYWVGVLTQFLPEVLALLVLTLVPVTVASRAWRALEGEGSNTGSFASPSVASCGPTCCSASTTGCSGRCSQPPSWPARSHSSPHSSLFSSRCPCRTGCPTKCL